MDTRDFYIATMFLVTMMFIHPTAQHIAYQKGRHLNGRVILPDLFHQLLPDNKHLKEVGDYMGILVGVVYVATAYFRGNKTDFFDWLKVLAIIYFMKSLTMLVTTMPDSQGHCEYKGFWNMGACNDLMFSCHTAFIAVTILYLSLMLPKWTYPLLFGYLAVALYFIVSTHNHYSVDVLMGLYVAFTLFLLRNKY